MPVNPNTERQNVIRGIFSSLVNVWTSTLTTVQRNAWTEYADSTPVINSLGNAVNLTGQMQYIRSNTPRIQAGLGRIDNAPVIFNTGEAPASITSLSFETGDVGFVGALGGPASDAGTLLAFLGRPLNESINFYKGPYQFSFLQAVAAAATALTHTAGAFQSSYSVAIGLFVPIRLRMTYADGRLSMPFEAIVEVEGPA
jgi:hypothetical protein